MKLQVQPSGLRHISPTYVQGLRNILRDNPVSAMRPRAAAPKEDRSERSFSKESSHRVAEGGVGQAMAKRVLHLRGRPADDRRQAVALDLRRELLDGPVHDRP